MKLPRRNVLHLAAGAAALPAVSRVAGAQAYPTRPVHWIVGFTPAGGTDIVARLMGQWLSNRIFKSYDDLVDHCCQAWNKLVDQPWRIMSIGLRQWVHEF
jgi:hypothetical protein